MNMILRVRNPFKDYAVGDEISDPTLVEEILKSDHENHVIRVAAPENSKVED